MGSRRKGRECALQILYQLETLPNFSGSDEVISPAHIQQITEQFFINFDAPAEIFDYASSLVRGTYSNLKHIDQTIAEHSAKWRLDRMAIVDRNVLRIATYELIFSLDLPLSIIMDEAIEIAKRFGNERSPAFINGILDGIASDVRKTQGGKKK